MEKNKETNIEILDKNTILYQTIAGRNIEFNVSKEACEPFGTFSGDRILTQKGFGTIVGVNDEHLWTQLDQGDPGAIKLLDCHNAEDLRKRNILNITNAKACYLQKLPSNYTFLLTPKMYEAPIILPDQQGRILSFDTSSRIFDTFGLHFGDRINMVREDESIIPIHDMYPKSLNKINNPVTVIGTLNFKNNGARTNSFFLNESTHYKEEPLYFISPDGRVFNFGEWSHNSFLSLATRTKKDFQNKNLFQIVENKLMAVIQSVK